MSFPGRQICCECQCVSYLGSGAAAWWVELRAPTGSSPPPISTQMHVLVIPYVGTHTHIITCTQQTELAGQFDCLGSNNSTDTSNGSVKFLKIK